LREVSVGNQTQLVRVLTGAAIGAGFAYLFLTRGGKHLLTTADPWLDEVIRDMQRLRGTAAKVRDAFDEGRRSFEAIAKLGSFENSEEPHPWEAQARH
jgi:hypothetical protein